MSVRNGLALFLALSALTFLAACGGSSPTPQPPPGGGFNAANFKGTYVVSISGTDANSNSATFFAIVGTITADGSGNITGGTVDIDDPNLGGFFPGQTVSASTYRVGADGRGTGTLSTPQGNFGLDFVITSNGHGLITRFDSLGSGSGTLDLQGSTSQSALQSLAFSLSGVDVNEFPLGSVGGFTLGSAGAINSGTGIQDFNDDGSSAGFTALPLSGSVLLTSGTSGTAQLNTSFGSLAFDVWVIDSTHLKLIETDTSGNVLAGDVFTQQTSFTAGQLAFTLGGLDSSKNPFVAGGFATTDVNGNLTSGIEDYNDAGFTATQTSLTGGCATFASGRCQLALTGFSNGIAQPFTFAAYPSSGGVLLLEDDSFGLAQGAAYLQAATSLGTPQGYGLNLSGIDLNSGFEVDEIAEFTAQNVGSNGSGSLTGLVDINDGGPSSPQSLGGGSYTPDSPATGRGSISTNAFTLEYYIVDGSNAIFIEGDPTQVALGTFQLQGASSSPGIVQPGISMMHATVRAHAAAARKQK